MGLRHGSTEWVRGLVGQSRSRAWAGDVELRVVTLSFGWVNGGEIEKWELRELRVETEVR